METRILCLEGITGAGKTAQATRISRHFNQSGQHYLIINEKQYEPFRQAIIDWHNAGAYPNFSAEDVIRFAKMRSETHKRYFVPLISRVDYLIFDRSVYTAAVYQADGELSPEEIFDINIHEGVLIPERGVVLLCSPQTAKRRIDERRKRKSKYALPSTHETIEEIEKRKEIYLQILKQHPELYLIDTTNKSEEEVFEEVRKELNL